LKNLLYIYKKAKNKNKKKSINAAELGTPSFERGI
jgi:hypothetical protein